MRAEKKGSGNLPEVVTRTNPEVGAVAHKSESWVRRPYLRCHDWTGQLTPSSLLFLPHCLHYTEHNQYFYVRLTHILKMIYFVFTKMAYMCNLITNKYKTFLSGEKHKANF